MKCWIQMRFPIQVVNSALWTSLSWTLARFKSNYDLSIKTSFNPFYKALSLNPKSILTSCESIVECGVTLTDPLKINDSMETISNDELISYGSSLDQSKTQSRSSSRLALVVGMSCCIILF